MMRTCNFPDCEKQFVEPLISCKIATFDDPFEFCSINHAIYFLGFPEKHWPWYDSNGITQLDIC